MMQTVTMHPRRSALGRDPQRDRVRSWRPLRGPAATGLAVGAIVLAACAPLKPPPAPPAPFAAQYCAPAAPAAPGAYEAAFDQVRQIGTEWVAADGGAPVTLPDGRVLWIYGDTLTGRLAHDGSLAPRSGLVHNSFIVQDGACFRPIMGGSADARTDLIPASGGAWYWPTAGVVEPTPSGDVLRVLMYHETHNSGPPPFNLELLNMRIASFTLPGLQLVGVQDLPNLPPNIPGGGGPVPSDQVHPWGQSTIVAGSTLYLYGRGTDPNGTGADAGRDHRVARVALGSLTTGPWEFYDGGTTGTNADWTTDPSGAQLMTFAADSPALPSSAASAKPYDPMFVVPNPTGGGYLSVGKLGELAPGIFGTEIAGWTAPTPQGPWHYAGKMAATSMLANQYSYGARLELGLPGGTPTVLYSVSTFDDPTKDPSLYGVRFTPPDVIP